MMETYNRWFHSIIEGGLGKYTNYSERIKFLYNEKSKFISLNRGEDANQVVLMFDNLIDKEKLLYELNKATNQETETFIDYSNKAYGIAGRVYYKRAEVEQALKPINF